MATRLYVVSELVGDTTSQSLVEAATPAQAIKHKVKARFTAEPAKPQDVVRLMSEGKKVERPGDEDSGE